MSSGSGAVGYESSLKGCRAAERRLSGTRGRRADERERSNGRSVRMNASSLQHIPHQPCRSPHPSRNATISPFKRLAGHRSRMSTQVGQLLSESEPQIGIGSRQEEVALDVALS